MHSNDAAKLAKLCRQAFCYEQIIEAKGLYPNAIAAAAQLLGSEQINRIKLLKADYESRALETKQPETIYRMKVERLAESLANISKQEFATFCQKYLPLYSNRILLLDAIWASLIVPFHRKCELNRWFEEEFTKYRSLFRK